MTLTQLAATIGIGAAALLACHSALADDEFINPDWANSAWYAGGSLGQSRARIDQDRIVRSLLASGAGTAQISVDERASAYQLFIGKQLTRHFAIEGGYFDLGSFGFNATTTPAGSLNGKVGFRGGKLDLVGQAPLSERFSLTGRIGMQYAKASTSFSGTRLNAVTGPEASERKLNPKIGLGMEYKLTEAFAVRADLERYRVNDAVHNRGDVDTLSFGLVYKFGRPPARERLVYTPTREVAPVPVVAAVAPTPPPAPAPVPQPVSEKVTFAAQTLFDFDKSDIKPEGATALDELMGKLKGMNTEVMVTVGHADSVGSDDYNQKLSLRRADAVKAYLTGKGLDGARIYTEGKGESQPVADNKTATGRSANRRVTVEVVGTRTKQN